MISKGPADSKSSLSGVHDYASDVRPLAGITLVQQFLPVGKMDRKM